MSALPIVSEAREFLRRHLPPLSRQFIKYGIVGGLAFVVDFGLFVILTRFVGVHYLVSNVLAFCVGLTVNYTLSILWVFDVRRVKTPAIEFALFAAVGVAALALNEALLWLLTEQAGLHYILSKMIAQAVVLLFNFGARKFLLF